MPAQYLYLSYENAPQIKVAEPPTADTRDPDGPDWFKPVIYSYRLIRWTPEHVYIEFNCRHQIVSLDIAPAWVYELEA